MRGLHWCPWLACGAGRAVVLDSFVHIREQKDKPNAVSGGLGRHMTSERGCVGRLQHDSDSTFWETQLLNLMSDNLVSSVWQFIFQKEFAVALLRLFKVWPQQRAFPLFRRKGVCIGYPCTRRCSWLVFISKNRRLGPVATDSFWNGRGHLVFCHLTCRRNRSLFARNLLVRFIHNVSVSRDVYDRISF